VAVTLQFFGTAGYRIVTGDGKSVLIDPYLDFSAASPLVGRQGLGRRDHRGASRDVRSPD